MSYVTAPAQMLLQRRACENALAQPLVQKRSRKKVPAKIASQNTIKQRSSKNAPRKTLKYKAELIFCQALVRMELVPVPCSCAEMILDHHLA